MHRCFTSTNSARSGGQKVVRVGYRMLAQQLGGKTSVKGKPVPEAIFTKIKAEIAAKVEATAKSLGIDGLLDRLSLLCEQ